MANLGDFSYDQLTGRSRHAFPLHLGRDLRTSDLH